jgi:hypothetical protein
MRWPWRRHGRRRRTDVRQQLKVDPWAASWGETFLPRPPLHPTVAEPSAPTQPQNGSTVRLGFVDGSQFELASGSEHFDHLLHVAEQLTRPQAGRPIT